MASVAVRLVNTEEFNRLLQRRVAQAPEKAAIIAVRWAERVMARAKVLCPVRWGALRASGHVQAASTRGGVVTVTVGFGGPAAPYAVIVHENLRAHHHVGQAKFLEQATLDIGAVLRAEVASDLLGLLA